MPKPKCFLIEVCLILLVDVGFYVILLSDFAWNNDRKSSGSRGISV